MVFDLDTGKLPVLNANSSTEENLSTGEVLFKISKVDCQKIVESSNRSVYITSIAQDGSENLMYSGEWRLTSEKSEIDELVNGIKDDVKKRISDAERIIELEKEVEDLRTKLAVSSNKSNIKGRALSLISKRAQAPAVNRLFTPNPTAIKTNRGNTQ